MFYLEEALRQLKEEDEIKKIFVDKKSGKTYEKVNGVFVEIKRQDTDKNKTFDQDDDDDIDIPHIGDEGDSDIQQLEDILREIQNLKNAINRINDQYSDDDESSINDISAEIIDSSQDLKQKIEELTKELEKLRKEFKDKGGELSDNQEEKINEKIDHIQEIFDDVQAAKDLMSETKANVDRSRKEKRRGEQAAKEAAKLANMSDAEVVNLIKQSLNQTLKSEIHENEEETWSKINRKAYGAGILKKGSRISEKVEIPSLNVYFDRSGSWGPDKTKFGLDAVNSIMWLEKKGKIKVRLYYFNASGVTAVDPGRGYGGTPAGPVFEHIRETKPENVFIMTDSDFDGQGGYSQPNTTVKGAVWMLFKGSISKSLREKLHGKKMTKTFFIK